MKDRKIIDDYLHYMKGIKEKSENTINSYKIDLNLLFDFLDGEGINLISDITLQNLHNFIIFCGKRGDAKTTRSRRVASTKSFFKYLYEIVKIIKNNPAKDLEAPKLEKRNPSYLTLSESKKLLSVIEGNHEERNYAIITLFLNCGMRLSELTSIDIDRIKDDKLTVIGKGNKERVIYLNNACLDAIKEYLKVRPESDEKALFLSQRKTRISNRMVQFLVKDFLEKAKLDTNELSTHSLRHSSASLMLKYGDNVDLKTLQLILGHSNISSTQIYTHIDNEQLRSAINSNPLNIKL